ncbi:MAG TPA: hypothetical protein VK619_12125 [Pyrinomonadaceae bacterium]|nr:hypothetical protein [Pyrinomonadaceae bacterium]
MYGIEDEVIALALDLAASQCLWLSEAKRQAKRDALMLRGQMQVLASAFGVELPPFEFDEGERHTKHRSAMAQQPFNPSSLAANRTGMDETGHGSIWWKTQPTPRVVSFDDKDVL